MKPSDITVEFVKRRATELMERWTERNTRMDDYERLYKLDLWENEPAPDERRVTLPTCFNTVEQFRALLQMAFEVFAEGERARIAVLRVPREAAGQDAVEVALQQAAAARIGHAAARRHRDLVVREALQRQLAGGFVVGPGGGQSRRSSSRFQ